MTALIEDIIKQCFWDYNYTVDKVKDIIENGTTERQIYLLKKIIANYKNHYIVIKIFPAERLKELIRELPIDTFKNEFQNKRVMVLRNIILGENNIPEKLRWDRSSGIPRQSNL